MVAMPRASGSTVASTVTSPSPTSSASARSIRSGSRIMVITTTGYRSGGTCPRVRAHAPPRSRPASADSPANTVRPRRVTWTRISPARWWCERSTARRSCGSGTVSACAVAGSAAPSSSTRCEPVRARSRHAPSRELDRGRRAAAQHRPVQPHDRSRGLHPGAPDADGPAGERDRDAIAEVVRLPPPPAIGEAAAPVLLRVRARAVERERRRARGDAAAHVGREQVRVPVLAEARERVRAAEPAERPPRPRDRRRQLRLEPAVRTEVESHVIRPGRERGARAHAVAGGVGGDVLQPGPAEEAARMGGKADERPRLRAARPVHAAHHDRHPAAGALREAPEVALHRDAVVAPRIAPRRVGPGAAVRSDRNEVGLHATSSTARRLRRIGAARRIAFRRSPSSGARRWFGTSGRSRRAAARPTP